MMLRRGMNKARENVATKASGTRRSVSADASGNETKSQQGKTGTSLQRFKNIAGGILGNNENDAKGGTTAPKRTALADKKNMVIGNGERTKKQNQDGIIVGENSKLSQLTNKIRRSFSASPKRSRSKSSESSRKTIRKGLAELVPRITAGGMRLRSRNSSGSSAAQCLKQKQEKPTTNETERANEVPTGKILKPLPFVNGRRILDDRYNNEVIYCDQYAEDNWDYLFYVEEKTAMRPNFLAGSRVTPKMRMTTLDWITRVQISFKLLPETHLTSVNLFDRCLMARHFTVDKKQIQLISLACAILAAKYEEIYPPEISDYLATVENTKKEIIHAEIEALNTLNFYLNHPRSIQFIRRLTEHYDLTVHGLAKTISDIAAYDYSTCHIKPSVIAAVSVYIAASLEGVEFPEKLHKMARVSKMEIERLAPLFANAVLELIKNEKLYGGIYKRMLVHRKLIFKTEHITLLSNLAAKIH